MEREKPDRRVLVELEPGQEAAFPAVRMKYIRTMACELGTVMPGRVYSTRLDRENMRIIVTRMA